MLPLILTLRGSSQPGCNLALQTQSPISLVDLESCKRNYRDGFSKSVRISGMQALPEIATELAM